MDQYDEEIISLLSDPTNRTILSILGESGSELTLSELAESVLTGCCADSSDSAPESEHEETLISLHHKRLPHLDDAGLLSYDPDAKLVGSAEPGSVDVVWEEFAAIDELLSRVTSGDPSRGDSVGVLACRTSIYEYCRRLADEADDELFLIYTSDDLLDEDCLPYAEDAIDRGVDFSAGARGERTRRFFREHLPDATVWEPQLDWLHPGDRLPALSRLVFADREKVAVGLWQDADADDGNSEIAMVGEGPDNPLVVLVRELLGPRLDHLDYQSDDFLGDLPFET